MGNHENVKLVADWLKRCDRNYDDAHGLQISSRNK